MKIVIIEDEKPAARRLARMIENLDLQVDMMLHSVSEAVDWFLNNNNPDLILLDIQLSDGLAFEIFDEVDVDSPIIFTTAYDEYALKAFKLNSVDYLLKPIDEDELRLAVEKFHQNWVNANPLKLNIEKIREALKLNEEKKFKKRFIIKIGQHLKMIPVSKICCFYSENRGTYFKTIDNRDYLVEPTLDQLEDELNPNLFFRINRKYIISMDAIEDMVSYTNSRIQIRLHSVDEDDLIVSREKVKKFKQWLD
ncbi:LytR/AlgR family response regulator transcription factor [Namhaeicola litoreus]|uniref:LytR/AlgR family response regulator transcription factor n=1 Tax=Namhaeicola litoreus TaxID=1052145 RepID=A0ABW3Y591_9FLAO